MPEKPACRGPRRCCRRRAGAAAAATLLLLPLPLAAPASGERLAGGAGRPTLAALAGVQAAVAGTGSGAPAGAAAVTAAAPAASSAASSAVSSAVSSSAAAEDPAAQRRALVERINVLRGTAAAPALRQVAALDEVAQGRAEEIGAAGTLPDESEGLAIFGRIQGKLARAGYVAHLWTESVTAAAGSLEEVVGYWQGQPEFEQAMRPDFSDIGIGVAHYRGVPLYLFLFAWPESEHWRRETAPLADLESIRRQVLERVNELRRKAGRPPLAADPRLDQAAQQHAEDMLARSYYAHESPDGSSPTQRVRAGGFAASLVGENIAARHVSVGEAMAGWSSSADHRRNMLDPRFTSLGVGVAVGSYEHPYQVFWVQELARGGQ